MARRADCYPTLRERLLSKAVINWETGCWEWKGAKAGKGYGAIRVEAKRNAPAHRVAYELIEGPIPEGLQLDHLCRNHACVNPAHLEPVTNRENQLRSPVSRTAQNASKTHCKNGHEFTPENTRMRTGAEKGGRACIACNVAAKRRWRDRQSTKRSMERESL